MLQVGLSTDSSILYSCTSYPKVTGVLLLSYVLLTPIHLFNFLLERFKPCVSACSVVVGWSRNATVASLAVSIIVSRNLKSPYFQMKGLRHDQRSETRDAVLRTIQSSSMMTAGKTLFTVQLRPSIHVTAPGFFPLRSQPQHPINIISSPLPPLS